MHLGYEDTRDYCCHVGVLPCALALAEKIGQGPRRLQGKPRGTIQMLEQLMELQTHSEPDDEKTNPSDNPKEEKE